MNLIIVSKKYGAKQVNCSRFTSIFLIGAVASLLLSSAFIAGFFLSQARQGIEPDNILAALKAEVSAEREKTRDTRERLVREVDAVTAKVGQVQGHLIRLDALGRRLTVMAELDEEEFDFSMPPALGGPEEPAERSQSLEIMSQSLNDVSLALSEREFKLSALETYLLNKNLKEQIHPEGRPVEKGWTSSFFGYRTDPITGRRAWHSGVDFASPAGSKIMAVAAGVVTWSGARSGYGNMIEIDHGDGYVTRYAHNQSNLVAVGDRVMREQVIGLVGSTGRATGSNLHFEVLQNGRAVDPKKFTSARR